MPDMGDAQRWAWQADAACRGLDTDAFFPTSVHGWAARSSRPPRTIQRICDACPVRIECLTHALRWGEVGIWGGTTDAQRAAIRRSIRRRSCPACGSRHLLGVIRARTQVCGDCGTSWAATHNPAPSRSHRPNLGLRPRHKTTRRLQPAPAGHGTAHG